MSRTMTQTLECFGETVKTLALAEIGRGAPVANVAAVLAGITGAVAAGAIGMRPGSAETIHHMIDQALAKGLVAHRLGGGGVA